MGIFDDVNDGVKAAMKAKDMPRVQTMRLIKNALQTAAKDNGTEDLADNDSVAVLRKLSKQRVESITAYEDAGRAELAADEKAELAVIDEFLPSLADEATTRKWVQDAIDKSGATDASQMGKVMGLLMKEHKGEMDGALAKTLAEEILKVQRPPPRPPPLLPRRQRLNLFCTGWQGGGTQVCGGPDARCQAGACGPAESSQEARGEGGAQGSAAP